MNFWEDFFSTDKIIYPAIGAFIAGILILTLAVLVPFNFTDIYVGVCMLLGFIIGNTIKVTKLEQQRKINNKLNKRKKL